MIIEGIAFPLDALNKNGWGIPSSDADNAINSLKNAVVRVCSRNSPHGCDITEDPKSEIGRVLDAWKDGSNVYTKVDITDSVAATKIKEGTWQKKWSVYGKAGAINEGWTNGASLKSITLVTNPAWEQSTFDVAASADMENKLLFFNDFSITASVGNTMDDNNITPPGGAIPAEFEQQLADSKKLIESLTGEKDSLAEQITALTKERDELKTVAASLKEEAGKMVSMDEVKQMIAAAKAEDREQQAHEAALVKLIAARAELGLETKAEAYAELSASAIEEAAAEWGQVQISASANQIKYPSNVTASSARLKIFDPFTGGYV